MAGHFYNYIQANDSSRLQLGNTYNYRDRERLKHVRGAAFDAYGLEHRACHPATRREPLEEIRGWAEHPCGKSIFWLNGMAGTGKSTIAYSVAEWLNQRGTSGRASLGASFFFKRGERDRTSAALFFPTIVRQLSHRIPEFAVHVDEAIDTDPDVCSKALGEQFNKLMKEPLQKLGNCLSPRIYVVVVDALDECQSEDDIRTLLRLWSCLPQSPHVRIRLFVTSRPELPIRLGFAEMSAETHKDMILHEVPLPSIEYDILAFLTDELARIRDDYNVEPLSGTPLPAMWPGSAVLHEITRMAVPLFIIAATICRFIQDQHWNPLDQLQVILRSRRTGQLSHLALTYLPILERAVLSPVNRTVQHRLYEEFRLIVGTIVTLAEPLSCRGLSALLNVATATIVLRLRPLHSVLQIPPQAEAPIRPLHLSFAEFLSSEEIRHQPFWIDRAATHAVLLTKCLQLLSQWSPAGLRENMCGLSYPGQPRRDLSGTAILNRLPPAVQYACRYWTYHAQHARIQICDGGEVHHFLQKQFLYWLEALSLLDCLVEAVHHLDNLQSLLPAKDSTHVAAFLQDARRFVLANRYICESCPLQLYSSAVVFAPQDSIVRNICGKVPEWITRYPITPKRWSAELQKLEGHSGSVNAVAFSPDGSQLASASNDQTIRLWDAQTGQEVQKLAGHAGVVWAVTFSPDGSQLASASDDQTVRLWDAKTGQEVQGLAGHTGGVNAVAFSPDGSQLASASDDRTVRLWDAPTAQEIRKLVGHTGWARGVAFSPDGSQLASASDDRTVRLWDARTGQEVQKLVGHTGWARGVAFSPTGSQLASASDDRTVRLWDVQTGQEVQKLAVHIKAINAVAVSPDGSQLASASDDRTIRLWDAQTGQEVQKLAGHSGRVRAVAFSPDGSQLASASDDRTVRLWDAPTAQEVQKLAGHSGKVRPVAFSSNGSQQASASDDRTIRLWDAQTGQEVQKLAGHSGRVRAVAFSPDGSQLASASDDRTVRLWDTQTGQEVQMLEGHIRGVRMVVFSPDGSQLASASDDRTVRLWDTQTGEEVQKLKGHAEVVWAAAFSSDGSQLASASNDQTVRLWNAQTGQEVQKLAGHSGKVWGVAFSPNGSQLASASDDRTVRLWDTQTGQEVQMLEGHTEGVNAAAFSPDGLQLATASWDRTVRLWDAQTGQEIQTLKGHAEVVWAVAFSPDGSQLASASYDQTVRLWDTQTGQEVCELEDNPHIRNIRFTDDQKSLLSDRGTINIRNPSSLSKYYVGKHVNNLVLKADWIEWGGRRVL